MNTNPEIIYKMNQRINFKKNNLIKLMKSEVEIGE
jgi:hypothetical protein